METIRVFSKKKENAQPSKAAFTQSPTLSGAIPTSTHDIHSTGQTGGHIAGDPIFAEKEGGMTENKGGTGSRFLSRIDSISLYLFLGLTFLIPLFVWPGLSIPFSKAVLTIGVVVILLVLWIIKQLKSDRVTIMSHPVPLTLIATAIIFFISSLLSGNYYASLFGIGFEVGTGIAVILGAALALLTPSILHTQSRIFAFLSAFFISFFSLALFQIIRLIGGPGILTLGVFSAATDTLLGKWNEIGFFFGLATLLSIVTLEALSLNRLFKTIAWIALVVSLIFLAITNFVYALIPIAVGSLLGFLYLYAIRRRISAPTIVVFIVATTFIFMGTKIHSFVNSTITPRLAISQVEVSPSLTHTMSIARNTLKENPLWGVGPNMFVQQWLKYKPDEVNQGQFWDTSFAYGRGLIPTYMVTAGALGLLIALLFLIVFIYTGFKSLFTAASNSFARYLLISSFLGSLYLWLLQLFYTPTTGLWVLTFLFTGACLAALSLEGFIPEKKFAYRESPRASFVWVMVLIVGLISAGFVGVIGWNKGASTLMLRDAYVALNADDVVKGETALKQAIAYESSDVLYRIMVDIQTAKMASVLRTLGAPNAVDPEGKKITEEYIAGQLSPLLTDALDYAGKAIENNPRAYENWLSLGSVYEGVMPLGYQGAYENAAAAYAKAMELAPRQPSVPLIMARLEASKPGRKDYGVAREWLAKALAIKQNYTEALFFDSQLSINEGNTKKAIATVAQVAFLRPSDATVFFQLGYLKYSDKDFKGAIEALNKAVELNAQYSNARYFLGLSLSEEGDTKGAIAQFEQILELNPDNQEVKTILQNLRAGRSAFKGEPAPKAESKTSTTKKLPVKGE